MECFRTMSCLASESVTSTTSFNFSVLKDTFIIRNSKHLNCVPNVTVEKKNLNHYFCTSVVPTAAQFF